MRPIIQPRLDFYCKKQTAQEQFSLDHKMEIEFEVYVFWHTIALWSCD